MSIHLIAADWHSHSPHSLIPCLFSGLLLTVCAGGFSNFLSLYNLVITARVLLSWFPQAQGVAALQPVFAITDPYLNLFRGIVPPIFGLDLSPLLAFFLLNVMTSATAAVGAEIPEGFRPKQHQHFQQQQNYAQRWLSRRTQQQQQLQPAVSMNL
jgi:YggT family protein